MRAALSVGTATRPRSGRVAGGTSVAVTSRHRPSRRPPGGERLFQRGGVGILQGPGQEPQLVDQLRERRRDLGAVCAEESGDHRRVAGCEARGSGKARRGQEANSVGIARQAGAGDRRQGARGEVGEVAGPGDYAVVLAMTPPDGPMYGHFRFRCRVEVNCRLGAGAAAL